VGLWAIWGFLCWGQYLAPSLAGLSGVQAPLQNEPLSANAATAFPADRWCAQAGTALYLPAPELAFRLAGLSYRWDTFQMTSLLLQEWRFDKLSQVETGLAYALRLLQGRVTIATRGRLLFTSFSEYGRLLRFTPDLGLILQPSPRLRIGGYGYNLLGRGWGLRPGPVQYGLGVAYGPSSLAEAYLELTQEGAYPLQVHSGFSYQMHPLLRLRAGVGWPTLTVGAGLRLSYHRLGLDMAYRYQPSTGSWAALGIAFP